MRVKKFVLIVTLLVLPLMLVSCDTKDDLIEIGILQYLEHDALTNARQGFIDGLEKEGFIHGVNVNIITENPETDQSTMAIQAKRLVRNSDLILGIATPAASALVSEAREQNKNTPILFTAVTDPVDAKLIASNDKPGANVTGTNDLNPISEQIALAKELLPNATKIGIIYNSNETNSTIQADIAEAEAIKNGLEVIRGSVKDVNDLQQIAGNVARQVDIIYTPTDNMIAGNIGIMNIVSMENNIPFIVGEDTLVPDVASLTIGINYYRLGLETAVMAVKILKDGILPSDIPSHGLSEFGLVINKKALNKINVTVPQSLIDRADEVFE